MKIGFYDSGLGGISIVKEFLALYPDSSIAYLADNAVCPLGEKSLSEIQAAVIKGVEFLFNKGCKLVILACNTACTTSIRWIQQDWLPQNYPENQVLSIISPTIEHFLDSGISKHQEIGVMATPATIRTQFYQNVFWGQEYSKLLDISCPGLAGAIESGGRSEIQINLTENLDWLGIDKLKSLDYLILACTHYPLVADQIRQVFETCYQNSKLQIISQGQVVGQSLARYLQRHPEYSPARGGLEVYNSLNNQEYQQILLKKLLG